MSKVYVIIQSDDENESIEKIFRSKKKAEAYQKRMSHSAWYSYYLEEHEVE